MSHRKSDGIYKTDYFVNHDGSGLLYANDLDARNRMFNSLARWQEESGKRTRIIFFVFLIIALSFIIGSSVS